MRPHRLIHVLTLTAAILSLAITDASDAQPPSQLENGSCDGQVGCKSTTDDPIDEWFELSARTQSGCLVVKKSNVRAEQQLILGDCGVDATNTWRYNNGLFHSKLNDQFCIHVGRGKDPEHGRKMRLFPCDETNDLQQFYHFESTGHIKLKSNENLCVEFHGKNANIGEDDIILKKCEKSVDGWDKVPVGVRV